MNLTIILAFAILLGPDINNDRKVDGADSGLVLAGWGKVTGDNFAADVNRDGTVNGADLGLVLGAWGSIVRRNDYGDGQIYLVPFNHDTVTFTTRDGTRYTGYGWGWRDDYPDGTAQPPVRVRREWIYERETP